MKRSLPIFFLFVLFFSCKKELAPPVNLPDTKNNRLFFQNVKSELKDSLSADDYRSIDINRLYKSKDAQGKGCFVRIGLLHKEIAIDFILLKTDTLGKIREGKIIHVDKDKTNGNRTRFGGRFAIASLNRINTRFKTIVNGKLKAVSKGTDLLEAEAPVGEQTLPDCVITCYSTEGNNEGDWYCYSGFYNDYSGGGGGYTFGYSGGGGSSTAGNEDNTIVVKVEPNDNSAIKVDDYLKCFSTIPDANASYKISIFSDLPVNGDPSQLFDVASGSGGHSFIQLVKSNGNMTVQQNVGFYPVTGWKSLSNINVGGKIVDNAGHEFNASLSTFISSTQFQAELKEIQAVEGRDYEITTWNCTDFALDIFNAGSSNPLTIPQYCIPGTYQYTNTLQALYVTIQRLQLADNDSFGATEIPGVSGWVGDSHGSCAN